MGNRDYQNFVTGYLVDKPVGETSQLATSDSATQKMPGIGESVNARQGMPSLVTEVVAQPCALLVVETRSLCQLVASWRQKPEPQTFLPSSANTWDASMAPSSPLR